MVDVLGSRIVGPLEWYAPGFAAEWSRQGYTVSGASQHLSFIAHLSRWMLACGRDVSALTPEIVDEYLAARRGAGYVNYRTVRAMRPLLDYLEPLGVLPQLAPVALGPVDVLLERYRGYLILERGLTAATARGYIDSVRPFVAGRARPPQPTCASTARRGPGRDPSPRPPRDQPPQENVEVALQVRLVEANPDACPAAAA